MERLEREELLEAFQKHTRGFRWDRERVLHRYHLRSQITGRASWGRPRQRVPVSSGEVPVCESGYAGGEIQSDGSQKDTSDGGSLGQITGNEAEKGNMREDIKIDHVQAKGTWESKGNELRVKVLIEGQEGRGDETKNTAPVCPGKEGIVGGIHFLHGCLRANTWGGNRFSKKAHADRDGIFGSIENSGPAKEGEKERGVYVGEGISDVKALRWAEGKKRLGLHSFRGGRRMGGTPPGKCMALSRPSNPGGGSETLVSNS